MRCVLFKNILSSNITRKNVVIPDRVLEATIYIILSKVH